VKIRHLLAALATAGALLAAGAVPAFAAGPPVPNGCTFDQSDGVLTCVTATSTTPVTFSDSSDAIIAPATVGPFTVEQFCDFVRGPGTYTETEFFDLTVNGTVTTTTATERHGLNGAVFNTSTSTSSVITGESDTGIACF
jgi:hypothetical protein